MPATLTPTVAPSATPAAAAPVSPAAPAAPAPVATVAEPTTLNDFAELARKSIAGELTATPVAPPPPPPGPEPSPEAVAAEPAQPEPAPEPEAPGEEPAAEDTANWTEGEKKLHGALQKERTESKEARATVRELQARLAELESKLTAPAPAKEAAPQSLVAPAAPVLSTALLADCPTFEAVDARVQQAATVEAQAMRLQNMLNRNGVEPVAERLKASGVTEINGKPIAEASPDEVGEFLASVYEGSRLTQSQASPRKAWLVQNQQAMQQAVAMLPELNDPQSEAYASALQLINDNPVIRQRADGPLIIAKLYLGEQAFKARSKTATTPAPAVAKPLPRSSPSKPAPGAPRTSVAAIPQPNANTQLAAKIADGTATLAEVQEYTRGHVVAA